LFYEKQIWSRFWKLNPKSADQPCIEFEVADATQQYYVKTDKLPKLENES